MKNLSARSFENSRWNVAAGTECWHVVQTSPCEASQSTSKGRQKRSTILSMVAVFMGLPLFFLKENTSEIN